MNDILKRDITFLKGVGERKAAVLSKELEVKTWGDLLYKFPYRHVDRTRIYKINELLEEMPYVQLQGEIIGFVEEGSGPRKRLKAYFKDQTGVMELVWFNSITYMLRNLKLHTPYVIFGKPTRYGSSFSMAHPEIELAGSPMSSVGRLYPMYYSTERMKKSGLSSKALSELQKVILAEVRGQIQDTLPEYIVQNYQMLPLGVALEMIHFPTDARMLQRAQARLKMEELFYLSLRQRYIHKNRKEESTGFVFQPSGKHFDEYRKRGLTFRLTRAQERVVNEIRADMGSGHQMNRLVQGDVGSGKTVVALLSMLVAIDNGFQVTMMAPTEILATQHYQSLSMMLARQKEIRVALLTGSMKVKERKPVLEALERGEIDILVGTHILIQDYVKFHKLGLAVIDEQHRFGVYQRSVLWEKGRGLNPHVLIMSATPIPRTLAMTLYGDLDVSIIDELPPGRTPIITSHAFNHQLAEVHQFIYSQLMEGRQCYVVYPLIEESEKSDMVSLEQGYDEFRLAFPAHRVGMVHGKLKPEVKEAEMRKFATGETHILVATTVIEVGVDVPNATVMIITSADRFGLSQLHQLRGRVGRGAHQSYCVLMSDNAVGETALRRINIMCQSTDGFYLAEEDLKMRGAGDLEGTQQSGEGISLKIANLSEDGRYVQFCNNLVEYILGEDSELQQPKNRLLYERLQMMLANDKDWGLIS
ncbi:MAG: ATP-dependent DNA helicase RecG [Bacteroidales bacterium]|uniref:ATP-dependent DNA helicase RecG n=1 Tax=Porphyromonas sp. TaxID=1924944 RepID=UPI002970D7B0|nr:ATP-dependent DNA helicase RecG [Porphyromonas sp.]MDD7437791.1 ATP-dependent DNA helicase RecG [Bacteroidales bacterium]MDY3067298.1 ATP-dependent DNA helicase RecG [Porphyromonas sp.]